MSIKKRNIIFAIFVLFLVFFAINFGFIWDNLKFTFFPPKAEISEQIVSSPVANSESVETTNKEAIVNLKADSLYIPSLGIKAPIVYALEANEESFQKALINGVAHYPGTVNVGEFGNAYIFGHSSDYVTSKGNYKHIFSLLPRIKIGAEILATNSAGNKFTYVVYSSRKVAANDVSVLDQQGYKKKLLTLQTSYPVGTALARWVVVAEIKNSP